VSPKKRGVPEDGLSKMQKQMEFMFGEMMSRFEDRFEKLETKVESGLRKKGRETRKKESVAGNSTEGAKDDFNHGSEFCTHSNDCMRLGQGGVKFSQTWILGIGRILMIWVM
jgi:hypothetical protein